MSALGGSPIVAIGETHGTEQFSLFLEDLVRDLGFQRTTGVIVLEIGSTPQKVIDD